MLSRILDGVTLRRVLAVLLVAAFAPEVVSLLSWLIRIGWGFKDVSTLQAFAVAMLQVVVEAAVIYLALRGLRTVLDQRRRRWPAIRGSQGLDRREEYDGIDPNAARWQRKGGGDGHGPDGN